MKYGVLYQTSKTSPVRLNCLDAPYDTEFEAKAAYNPHYQFPNGDIQWREATLVQVSPDVAPLQWRIIKTLEILKD